MLFCLGWYVSGGPAGGITFETFDKEVFKTPISLMHGLSAQPRAPTVRASNLIHQMRAGCMGNCQTEFYSVGSGKGIGLAGGLLKGLSVNT